MRIRYVGVINKVEVRDTYKEIIDRETALILKESEEAKNKALKILKGN